MKLTIGNGTPIEMEYGVISVEHGCTVLKDTYGKLVVAYRLHPGETVRRVAEGEYVVSL